MIGIAASLQNMDHKQETEPAPQNFTMGGSVERARAGGSEPDDGFSGKRECKLANSYPVNRETIRDRPKHERNKMTKRQPINSVIRCPVCNAEHDCTEKDGKRLLAIYKPFELMSIYNILIYYNICQSHQRLPRVVTKHNTRQA